MRELTYTGKIFNGEEAAAEGGVEAAPAEGGEQSE